MAMGGRSKGQQQEMFAAASEIRVPGNLFCRALEKHGFDAFVEDTCRAFHVENRGVRGCVSG